MNEEIPQWMRDHEKADNDRFDHIIKSLRDLPTREDIAKLATEKSVKDVVEWQKNIVAAGQIISTGGKWGYHAVIVLAGFLGALAVIVGGWKALAAFLFSPKP